MSLRVLDLWIIFGLVLDICAIFILETTCWRCLATDMDRASRPAIRPDGPAAVAASEEGDGDATTVGAAGASTRTSRANHALGHGREPESRCRARNASTCEGRGVKHTVHLSRRASSGYFSSEGDSLPSSPVPATVDKASQTTSPAGQVLNHALWRAAGERRRFAYTTGSQLSPSSAQQQNAAGDMQAVEVGRELRRIGDDFNKHLLGMAGRHRHRWVLIQPVRVPHVRREPAVLLCVGLLLFVIGRMIYSQGGSSLQGRSQV